MAVLENEVASELYEAIVETQADGMDTAIILNDSEFAVVKFSTDEVWIVSVKLGTITDD